MKKESNPPPPDSLKILNQKARRKMKEQDFVRISRNSSKALSGMVPSAKEINEQMSLAFDFKRRSDVKHTITSFEELFQRLQAGETVYSENIHGVGINAIKQACEDGKYFVNRRPQVVDMRRLVGKKIDCEFSNSGDTWVIDELSFIAEGDSVKDTSFISNDFYERRSNGETYRYCRPRLAHPFVWAEQDLPEGLDIQYGYVCAIGDNCSKIRWESDKTSKYGHIVLARIVGALPGYEFDEGP
jgi:hypothetical protein